MARHVVWQTILALLGIALIFIILTQLVPEIVVEEVPAPGGTYIEGVVGYVETINPILSPSMVQANPVDQDLCALVFDGLTTLDETGQVTTSLAVSWEVSEDGEVYLFSLRQGVTWQDGAPFTAADVAFTVQAMQDPNYQGNAALRELWRTVTVEQVDEYTVRFTLAEPLPSFLQYTTIGLLPAHLLSDVPPLRLPTHRFSKQNPVGTGMFMVESISSDRVVLAANPNYWGPKPYLERLEFRFFENKEDLLLAYERGEIQGFHPDRSQSPSDLARFPNLQIYSAQSASYGIVYLNLARETAPFFQTKEVRQALLYALDRPALIGQALEGQALVADSPILPTSWAYDPSLPRYRYDPERAIGLLDASGWQDSDADRIRDKDGVPLRFTLLTDDDPVMVKMAEEIARQWQAVGVDAQVQSIGGGRLPDLVRKRDFDAVLIEVNLAADPDPYPLWHSTQAGESGQNFSGWANDQADLLMEEGRSTADSKRRAELYRSFQQIFVEEVPSLVLYYPTYTYAVDAQVRQVQIPPLLHTSDRFRAIHDWYVATSEVVITEAAEFDKRSR